jgi:hypothetical protein
MTYQIIDNFLEKEEFSKIKSSILNPHFSWNLTTSVSNLEENLKTTCILLFDPSKPHNSTTCTDDKCRVNVNFNYF